MNDHSNCPSAKTTIIQMFFPRLKIRFEHDAEKFSKILFTLSRSGRCLPYRCKIHTYTPYDLLHTVVCDITNTQYQDFDRLSKGSIHHQTTYVHAYNDTVIVA